MIGLKAEAIRFAEDLAGKLAEGGAAKAIWEGVSDCSEHKRISGYVIEVLDPLVHDLVKDGWLPKDAKGRFDWEGRNRPRGELQEHSYFLLGTGAHPDAAVLEPFTVAFEFDREPAKPDTAHFKACLMKAAVHVLCGAYDATVFIYTLTRKGSTANTYIDDPDDPACTHQLLRTLRGHGLVVQFVGRSP